MQTTPNVARADRSTLVACYSLPSRFSVDESQARNLQRIDEVITHYPVKRSATLMCCT